MNSVIDLAAVVGILCLGAALGAWVADRPQRVKPKLVERTHAVVIPFPSVPRSFTSGQVTRKEGA